LKAPSRPIKKLFEGFEFYCSKGLSIHNANQLAFHEANCNGCIPCEFVIYEKSNADDIFANTSEKLSDIVTYIFRVIKELMNGETRRDAYENYCIGLGKICGSHPPYQKAIKLEKWDKKSAVELMMGLIPTNEDKLNTIVHKLFEKIENFKTKFETSESKVLKVIRSGDSINMNLYCISVTPKETTNWFSISRSFELTLKYQQKNFFLLKEDVEKIIEIANKN
jgi:hypothetical protein